MNRNNEILSIYYLGDIKLDNYVHMVSLYYTFDYMNVEDSTDRRQDRELCDNNNSKMRENYLADMFYGI